MSIRELTNDGEGADESVLDEAPEASAKTEPASKPAKGGKASEKDAPKKVLRYAGIELVKWSGEKKDLAQAQYGKARGNQPAKFVKAGAAKHVLQAAGPRRYKLLAVFRGRGGVSTKLLALLRDTAKHPGAQSLIKGLKKEGFLVR